MNARTGATSSPLSALRQPLSREADATPPPPRPESRKGPDAPAGLAGRERPASIGGQAALPPRGGRLLASPSSLRGNALFQRQRALHNPEETPAAASHQEATPESTEKPPLPAHGRPAAVTAHHAAPPPREDGGEPTEALPASHGKADGHAGEDIPFDGDGGMPHGEGPGFPMPHFPPTPSHPSFGHGDDDPEDGEEDPHRPDGSTRRAISAQEQQIANQNALTEASVRAQMQAALNEFTIKSSEGVAKAIKSLGKSQADLIT